ncbi:Pectate lyase superfamily protein [compost metagenome]
MKKNTIFKVKKNIMLIGNFYFQVRQKVLTFGCTALLLFAASVAFAQKEAKIFTDYRTDKSVLPDFSYVGYHHGEINLPNIKNYRVFNVTDFGAKPDDTISDKIAIQKTINAANKQGGGIVFFPKGRFLVNESTDLPNSIISKGSNIIFRGSGSGTDGTELFMKNTLPAKKPTQMWTAPPLFIFTSSGIDKKIGTVATPAKIGSFELKLNTTDGLKEGDWIILNLLDNNKELIASELKNNQADPTWDNLVNKGIHVKVFYQIQKIKKDIITLTAPIPYNIDTKYTWEIYKFANSQEIGIEDIAFVGNWKEKFVHHRSWQDDSGYKMLNFSRTTNSWMKNCRFTDCTNAAAISQSANVSVIKCKITGNAGHQAINSNGSTNVLIAKCIDEASQWHSFGSSHGAMNTVIWKCTYPSTTCFESHASQPRNTLLDGVEGGFMKTRGGGSIADMPNHMQGLVLWNFKQTNDPIKEFEFWPTTDVWWKIPNPIVVGFSSKGTTFKTEQLGYFETLGEQVEPASLYEAQLKLRLKKTPQWLKTL